MERLVAGNAAEAFESQRQQQFRGGDRHVVVDLSDRGRSTEQARTLLCVSGAMILDDPKDVPILFLVMGAGRRSSIAPCS
jgi:hypothetical protein